MMLHKQKILTQGKAKTLYTTEDPTRLILEFRDDTSAFNGEKKQAFAQKGSINNQISFFIMHKLSEAGIETHIEKQLGPSEIVVKNLDMIRVEAVIRNKAAGSICRRLGLEQGLEFASPLFELFLKDDALGDPLLRDEHAITLGFANSEQIAQIKALSFKINDILVPLFHQAQICLVDFKLEFGVYEGRLVLGDEFSPDGCRLWDMQTGKILDKDRFRQGLDGLIQSYQEVAERLKINVSV